ncbi:MAG: methyl-accepting chemotaxis protein [Lachnospiraceae bacterium]|nr:methyl-accepting chemotaxis protein [Lachnospiraceae bacterium]MBQ9234692.1 methyl-accepting chemotaxis protein [Lachnospiraceae bacterium]
MDRKRGFLSNTKTRLIMSMAAICIIPLAIAVIISFISSSNSAKDDAEKLNLKQAEYVENYFNSTMNANLKVMQQVAMAASTVDFVKDAENEERFERIVAQLQFVDTQFDDGNSTVITGQDGQNLARSKGDFTNIFDREYFQIAIKGYPNLSAVSISKTTGARIIVPAVPIYDADGTTVIGVLTRNYNIGHLHDLLLAEATEGQTLYIVDNDGMVVATSAQELGPEDSIDMSGEKIFEKISAGEERGTFIEKIDGKKKITSFIKEPISGWTIVVSTEYNVIMAASNKATSMMLIIGIILAIIAIIIAIIIGNGINGPIKAMDESLMLLANGEFKQINGYQNRKDEFGAMVLNTNSVINKLDSIVASIRETANVLDKDSTDVANRANSITSTMDGISSAVQDISAGASQQADEIQQATESIHIISGNIEGVTDDANGLAKTAQIMNTNSRSSEKDLQALEQSTNQMATAIQRIMEVIDGTSRAVNNISTKIADIDSIATQTNLLALNASIEAARAGEAGRGFVVVAEEIGKLATESANSANEIKEEMDKLLMQTEETVHVADDVAQTNKYQYDIITTTVNNIQSLISEIQNTVNGVDSINNNATACNDSRVVVVDAMTNISAISEQNAASTEETSASMEDINNTVTILAREASELKEHADKLMEEMKFFK